MSKEHPENPLTFETIKEVVEKMEQLKKDVLEIIPHPILKGMQTVIRQGNRIYYSPDMKAGEVKVITLPEIDWEIKPESFGMERHKPNWINPLFL